MHHVRVEFVNRNKEVLEGGDFEVCGSRLLGTGWGGVTAFRQWYVGCGGHGVRGAVLYGGWVERMLGEKVVVWWFGGGGGAACGNGGVMRVVRMVPLLAGFLSVFVATLVVVWRCHACSCLSKVFVGGWPSWAGGVALVGG